MELNSLFENIERQQLTDSGISFSNNNLIFTNIVKKKFLGFTIFKKIFEIRPEEFFNRIKKSRQQIKLINGVIDNYLNHIKQAEKYGQVALIEKLKDEVEVVTKEALAYSYGIKEYLTQSQVEKLLIKSVKNIEISFIKNFIRPIPKEFLSIKEKLDNEKIFIDYVVLHYNSKKENTAMTKKEKAKDPILFGLIKGSRNFYYIGDWIDEYCNLTLKEAVNIIEEKSKLINNKFKGA